MVSSCCGNRRIALILLLAILLWPRTAFAYLDPGFGSVLFQGFIAVVGATAATIGLYWRTVTGLVRRIVRRRPDVHDDKSPKP